MYTAPAEVAPSLAVNIESVIFALASPMYTAPPDGKSPEAVTLFAVNSDPIISTEVPSLAWIAPPELTAVFSVKLAVILAVPVETTIAPPVLPALLFVKLVLSLIVKVLSPP